MGYLVLIYASLILNGPHPPLPDSYDEALEVVGSASDCQGADYPHLSMKMYLCEEQLAVWYFTVPDDTLPPGFIRRMIVEDGKALNMLTQAQYFGTDEQESVFFEWQAAIVASTQQNINQN